MAFEGYLLKRTFDNAIFPAKYMEIGSWSSTPNQREEIRAYRDDNTRDLVRVTAQGRKSKITFKSRKNLHLADKQVIQDFFVTGELETGGSIDERKIQLTFWNDESNEYKTGWFYRPNMDFPIVKVTKTDIIYGQLEFTLVEY